jgi:hypothetical protein
MSPTLPSLSNAARDLWSSLEAGCCCQQAFKGVSCMLYPGPDLAKPTCIVTQMSFFAVFS